MGYNTISNHCSLVNGWVNSGCGGALIPDLQGFKNNFAFKAELPYREYVCFAMISGFERMSNAAAFKTALVVHLLMRMWRGLEQIKGVAYFVVKVMYHFINLLMSVSNNILVLFFMLCCTGAASCKLTWKLPWTGLFSFKFQNSMMEANLQPLFWPDLSQLKLVLHAFQSFCPFCPPKD